jgi:hypothetical protein
MMLRSLLVCEFTKPASQSGEKRHRELSEPICNECRGAAGDNRRTWRESNREKAKAYRKVYYEANRTAIRAKQSVYREAHGGKMKEARANWRRSNPDKIREMRSDQHLRDAHEMSRADWQDIWDAQTGRCYLCGDQLVAGNNRKVHVDHDHSCCGPTRSCALCRRGLACYRCNISVGMSHDDPERLMRIASNLARAQADVHKRQPAP